MANLACIFVGHEWGVTPAISNDHGVAYRRTESAAAEQDGPATSIRRDYMTSRLRPLRAS